MQERGITKYTLHKEYHFSKSLIHRLQNNEGVSMNTINTLCNILDCKVDDIAHLVLFLCSEEAGFITGENICVDGGMTKLMIYHNDYGWKLGDEDYE